MGCQTDKDVREPTPVHTSPDSPTSNLPSGKVESHSSPNFVGLLNNKLKKVDSNSRQHTLADDSPTLLARLKTDYQINSLQDSCPIIHSIDLVAKKLVSFNVDTQVWNSNNLAKAALHSSNPLFIPLRPLEDEVLVHLEDATAAFVSEQVVHFIGPKHFALDTKQNMFSYKKDRESKIKNPTLCKIGNYIYALSGCEGSEYTTKCEEYNIQENTWTPIAPLNRPYYKGSACGFIDSNGHHKLIIVGGISNKSSGKTNQTMSIYNIATNQWTESQIKLPVNTDPAAPSYPLFAYDDNNLSIITPKDDKIQQSLINITTGKFSNHRELTTKEKLSSIIAESFCVHKGNLSVVMSEKVLTKEKAKNCVMICVKV